MKNIFYVYAYLDPRKQGKFVYGDYSFDYEPFYIGKGFGNRMYVHLKNFNLVNDNSYKTNKIKKLLKSGFDVKSFVFRIKQNLSEHKAMNFEMELIKTIGRLDLKTGPLTNLTDGGDGTSGRIVSEKEKEIHRLHALGNKNCLGKTFTEEHRKKLSNAAKIRGIPLETIKKANDACRGKPSHNKGKKMNIEHRLKTGMAKRKFTDEEVVEMKRLHAIGMSYYKIAKIFKCSFQTPISIINNKRLYLNPNLKIEELD